MKLHTQTILSLIVATTLSGCSTLGNVFNPFYDSPPPEAYLGEKNDSALRADASGGETARQALEAMSTYQRAQAPQPNNPVIQPAVVRLMWVPDHLNTHGDLVPAHYYYLKVKKDSWAVTDAFELEAQLGGTQGGSAVGFVTPEDIR